MTTIPQRPLSELFLLRAEWWSLINGEMNDIYEDILIPARMQLLQTRQDYGIPADMKLPNWSRCRELQMWCDLLLANVLA